MSNTMEEKVQQLISTYGQNDQRTDAWHLKRGSMLTASEIWKAMKDASPSARYELIMSKLTPRKEAEGIGARALIWGTRLEPIAKEIYSKIEQFKLGKNGVYVQRGKSWDCITGASIRSIRY